MKKYILILISILSYNFIDAQCTTPASGFDYGTQPGQWMVYDNFGHVQTTDSMKIKTYNYNAAFCGSWATFELPVDGTVSFDYYWLNFFGSLTISARTGTTINSYTSLIGSAGWSSFSYTGLAGDVVIVNSTADLDGFVGDAYLECTNFNYVLPCSVSGCTDCTAINFDPTADNDDGTCLFHTVGCTYSAACNYNPAATRDDLSCDFTSCNPGSCSGDANSDGFVNVLDLIAVSSSFGDVCE